MRSVLKLLLYPYTIRVRTASAEFGSASDPSSALLLNCYCKRKLKKKENKRSLWTAFSTPFALRTKTIPSQNMVKVILSYFVSLYRYYKRSSLQGHFVSLQRWSQLWNRPGSLRHLAHRMRSNKIAFSFTILFLFCNTHFKQTRIFSTWNLTKDRLLTLCHFI